MFDCKVCDVNCMDKLEYKVHCDGLLHRTSMMLKETIDNPTFKCSQCDVLCKGVDSFERHLASEEHIEHSEKNTQQAALKRSESESELLTLLTDEDDANEDDARPIEIEGLRVKPLPKPVAFSRSNSYDEAKDLLDEIRRSTEKRSDQMSIDQKSIDQIIDTKSIDQKSSYQIIDRKSIDQKISDQKPQDTPQSNVVESDDSDIEIIEEYRPKKQQEEENRMIRCDDPKPGEGVRPPAPEQPALEPTKADISIKQTISSTHVSFGGLPQTFFQPANAKKHPTRNAANLVQLVVDQALEPAKRTEHPAKFQLSSRPVPPVEKSAAVKLDSSAKYDSSALDVSQLGLEYTRKEIRQAFNWETPKAVYSCLLCRCQTIGFKALEQHLRGKRHLETFYHYKHPVSSSYVHRTRTQSWQDRQFYKNSNYWQGW